MAKNSKQYLHIGTEVITNDFRVAIVDTQWTEDRVTIRYHTPLWPFPEWDIKTRRQLTEVPVQYDDAPF
jgi:hypothetical protein